MSFAGFKKQYNKTSQYLSEKVGGNKGSQLDEEFTELQTKLDVVNKCVEELHARTREYLQPNPNARTKLAMQASIQKARGQAKSAKYPQAEETLGDVFTRGGTGIGDDSPYAATLIRCGETFAQLSEVKDSMEYEVKQNFLDPLFQLQQKDLKEIAHHRKKLESRRLDYDYKKGKGVKGVPEEELSAAEEKFEESKDLCYNSMVNFMESDVEHIGQIHAFAEAVRDYHRQCADTMESLVNSLASKLSEAASRPRAERTFISRPISKFDDTGSISSNEVSNEMISAPMAPQRIAPPPVAAAPSPPSVPSCRGLYDFDPENEGELGFREGDIIELTSRIDENWLEGRLHGVAGFFPDNYVEIVVPL